MWRLTKAPKYRARGWAIFEAFRTHGRHENGGYTNLDDVFKPAKRRDEMPSYWIAETLKYLWLTFSDGVVPLDKYVFSTEAHPMPIVGK